jgi:predicted GTPase
MMFGAATVAARQFGAGEIVEARKYAVGSIKETFKKYPTLDTELPAMGYTPKQIRDLEATINMADCDVVVSATPTDLKRLVNSNKPIVQIYYDLLPVGKDFDVKLGVFVKGIKR